jgi:hypothetical protein
MAYSDSNEHYYPVSASLSLEMMTMEIATTDMVDNIFTSSRG